MKRVGIAGLALGVLLGLAAGLTGCGRAGAADGKLQVMYSGNLRGSVAPCGCHTPKGGIARWVSFMHRHEDPSASWLTVDAGNFVDRVGNGGCSNKCQFLVASYRDLHYDVLNIGKQEAWMGYETLAALRDTAKGAAFISANLVDAKSKRPFFAPTYIRDYGKLRVGVLGLLNEQDFPRGNLMLDSTRLAVTSALEAAKKYLPELIRKTDAVVVVCELPSQTLDTLVKRFPQIDLIISTGALRSGETPTTIGKTRIVGSGSSGYAGHYATLEFKPAWKDSAGFTQFQDFLTDTYDEKGPWADRLAAFNATPATAPTVPAGKPSISPSATPIPAPTLKGNIGTSNMQPSTSNVQG